MLIRTPTHYFLVAGDAEGYMELNAFDAALLRAGVGNTNLVKISSILPPGCRPTAPVPLPAGALVPVAYAAITCSVPGEIISAAVAVAVPEDEGRPGLIMEYSAYGRADISREIVVRMAEEGMRARGVAVREIHTAEAEHKVENKGAAFAGVVLWEKSQ
ncbi:pyruvoyl-dependent arginine decarboxylase [Deferrisoma camini]|uniref:pyruvoyl-dependent arginine decarboxylase n=1 Tax=Deferrisoma camini TaxID=1035120 RepID=UPI0004B987CF|nr:arginine decarboxylase, pyruvoyl-dependent [Deferrisoma camini]